MKKLNNIEENTMTAILDSKNLGLSKRKYGIIFQIIGTIGMLLVSLVDLQISENVADSSSRFGIFFEDYGQIPGYICIIVAMIILLTINISDMSSTPKPNGLFKNKPLIRMMIFIVFTIMFFTIISYISSLTIVIQAILSLIVAGLCSITLFISLRDRTFDTQYMYKRWAKITIWCFVINTLIITQLMKILWGRVRYSDLDSNQSNYSAWYVINFPNGNYSFPSGHTVMAWLLLPLFVLTSEMSRNKRYVSNSIIVLWGVLMAIARVIIGAHYLTDVLFSTTLSVVTYLVLKDKIA